MKIMSDNDDDAIRVLCGGGDIGIGLALSYEIETTI